jgi:cell division protease FtsH
VREDGLPEGNQWRYSEFINAVNSGKVERVRFSKDGTMLQVRVGRACVLGAGVCGHTG